MTDSRLEEALNDERAGRFIESFRRCLQLLGEEPQNAGALALASRLSMIAGDAPNAIAYACEAVRCDRSNAHALQALGVATEARVATARAIGIYSRAVELEPDIAEHVAAPGSQLPFAAISEVQALLEEAIALDPGLAQAHAAIGNLCTRRAEYLAAMGAYQRAAYIAGRAEYALALSEILFSLGQFNEADLFRKRALERRQLFPGRATARTKVSVLALMAPGPWPVNAPLDFAIDRSRVRLTRLYLTGAKVATEQIAGYDAIVNAIGEAEKAQPAVRQAIEIFTRLSSAQPRLLNNPQNSHKTARLELAEALRPLRKCVVPAAQRVSRAALRSWSNFPAVARPVDSHGGRGLAKLERASDVAAFLRERNEDRFDVAPFIDYRSPDDFYRKYRVALIGGVPYPYHLAISPEWIVHYIGSPTANTPWMRAEEERFLAHPRGVFPDWATLFPELAQAIGLDYFAIDCTLLRDGRLLVFEADIASLLHCREPAGSYKYRYVPQLFGALERLFGAG